MTPSIPPSDRGIAPGDAAPRRAWRAWGKIVAYIVLAGMALAAVRIIDRRVDATARPRHGPDATRQSRE